MPKMKEVKENLLNNAKSSIQLGIEDFDLAENDKNRKISSIRNSVAGLLLLYKYKLLLESQFEEDKFKYIRKKNYNGNIQELPRQTATVKDIKDNFNSLNLNLPDISFLDEIIDTRNQIEHFYQVNEVDILQLLVKIYYLIERFYDKYLVELHGRFEEFITIPVYQKILNNKQIYTDKLEHCRNSFDNIIFPSDEVKEVLLDNQKCPSCKSNLIECKGQDDEHIELICKYCLNDNLGVYDVLELTHRDILDGGDYRYACPECYDMNVINGVCFSCGYELEADRDYEREAYIEYLMSKND